MGSRLNNKTDLAYIAGFLDGDGSIMLQVKKRSDMKKGYRFMATICFYQDSRHAKPLRWIRETFAIGYFSNRKDGISELRINGFQEVQKILLLLQPFIKFKKPQLEDMLRALKILLKKSLSRESIQKIVSLMYKISAMNYASGKRKSKREINTLLRLTP